MWLTGYQPTAITERLTVLVLTPERPPTLLVPTESALGRTTGVLNRIEIDGEPVGSVAFSGPGAGGPATSSAVLADLIAVSRGLGSTWAGLPPAGAA